MLFDISELPPAGAQLDVEVLVPDFDLGDEQRVTVLRASIAAFAKKTRRGIEISGRFSALTRLPCSRCLVSLDYPISSPIRLFVLPGGDAAGQFDGIADDDPDAIDLFPIEGSVVDLADVLREQIDLALPFRVRCADVDRECGPSREARGRRRRRRGGRQSVGRSRKTAREPPEEAKRRTKLVLTRVGERRHAKSETTSFQSPPRQAPRS
ncbi:MAG: DUF177 domain-containing protein [Acidobacteria bacterium]|nr:DUF177 domain-containing protein [Acidobacteriota bacterium]